MFSKISQRHQEYRKTKPDINRPFGLKRVIIYAGIIAVIILVAAMIMSVF